MYMKRSWITAIILAAFCAAAWNIVRTAAAAPHYVDGAGSCASKTPCYTTISAAVAASQMGDTIYVFPGTYAESVNLSTMKSPGDINLITVDAAGTPQAGTATVDPGAVGGPGSGQAFFNSISPFPGSVTFNGFTVDSPDADGVRLTTTGDAVLSNLTATSVGGGNDAMDGFHIVSQSGDITMTNSTATGCSGAYSDGFELDAEDGNVYVSGSTANNNQGASINDDNDGFELIANGTITVINCSADNNTDEGFDLQANGNITVKDSDADHSGDDSFDIETLGTVLVENCFADNSGDEGYDIDVMGTVTIKKSTADHSYDDGFDIENQGDVLVADSEANNAIDDEDADGFDIVTTGNVQVLRSHAYDNAQEGIDVEFGDGDVLYSQCAAIGNGGEGLDTDEIGGNITIQDSVSFDNASDGVQIAEDAVPGGAVVSGSIICGNVGNGLGSYQAVTTTAEGNFWGDISGPTHPGNPAGTGDQVQDGANGLSGTVDFDPWIDTITPSGPAEAVPAGMATTISFQFSGGSGTVFLGQGPGDPNAEPLFTISTDNGALTSSTGSGALVKERINQANGTLTVMLTPGNAGLATVTLDGPCSLDSSIQVEVSEEDVYFLYLPLILR
jgi:hypothetical protein